MKLFTKNYFWGILSGLFLAFLIIPFLALVSLAFGPSRPPISSNSALVVRLSGAIPERIDAELPLPFLTSDRQNSVNLRELTELIRSAATDDDIKTLVLRCRNLSTGWAQSQELRWAIEEFKESEKPVWAFLMLGSALDYYVASLADRVVTLPESILDIKGLRAEVVFYKGAFEKLGINAEAVRVGKYKSAVEPFTRTEMSSDFRAVINEMLDEMSLQLFEGIVAGRGEDAAHWSGVMDEGPFLSVQAKEHGLVDDVLFEDEFFEQLSKAVDVEKLNRVSAANYATRVRSNQGSGKRIAVLHANGPIVSGEGWIDPMTGRQRMVGSETFVRHLDELRKSRNVAGVILRINSPGGEVTASEQILHAVRMLSKEKPLVISMSNMAASGGYYIASVADTKIIAYPGTYTGSIGVFMMKLSMGGLYEKLGLSKEIITRGRNAAIDTDYRPMTRQEREKVQQGVESVYKVFLTRVSEARGMDVDAVNEIAQGRVWLGKQALENGLIDELGGYQKAIELVKEAAEIEVEDPVQLFNYPAPRSFFQTIMNRNQDRLIEELFEVPLLADFRNLWEQNAVLAALHHGGMMQMMPYTLTIQ